MIWNYFSNSIFLVLENSPACILYKYIPLGRLVICPQISVPKEKPVY